MIRFRTFKYFSSFIWKKNLTQSFLYRKEFYLEEGVGFTNHGSFGTVPRWGVEKLSEIERSGVESYGNPKSASFFLTKLTIKIL